MSTDQDRADTIKRHLLVKESEIFEELLARARQYIKLDESGAVHIVGATSRFSARQMILLHLLGRKLAYMADLAPSDALAVAELSSATGSDTYVVSARLTELKKEGLVEASKRGSWRIVFARVSEVFEVIDSNRGPKPRE